MSATNRGREPGVIRARNSIKLVEYYSLAPLVPREIHPELHDKVKELREFMKTPVSGNKKRRVEYNRKLQVIMGLIVEYNNDRSKDNDSGIPTIDSDNELDDVVAPHDGPNVTLNKTFKFLEELRDTLSKPLMTKNDKDWLIGRLDLIRSPLVRLSRALYSLEGHKDDDEFEMWLRFLFEGE